MKIVTISDTHRQHDKIVVPDGDVLIHSGDYTGRDSEHELIEFARWLRELPHKHKIFVPGNHDFIFQDYEEVARGVMEDCGVTTLVDQSIDIDGVHFYGTPYQPVFYDWAFNLPDHLLEDKIMCIHPNTDVLITHTPPYGILDKVKRGHVGCKLIREHVDKYPPKVHVFGHIHEGYGTYTTKSTKFINAACLDGEYTHLNKPIVFDLKED